MTLGHDFWTIPRSGDVDLAFQGTLLADESSRVSGNTRWQEVRIYCTDSGKIVTEMVGRSIRDGETDRISVVVHDDTDTIRPALMRPSKETGRPYLTDLAFNALHAAGQRDHRIMAILTEHI